MVPLFFFLLSLQRIWFRSSMDRMKDSGSFDMGSSPVGITTLLHKEVCRNARCTFFLIHYHTTRFIFFKL